MENLKNKVAAIQKELKAPKNQYNNFGKYKYRSCEDILEAVKPLLAREGLVMTISDQILEAGSLVYVEATVRITDGEDVVSTTSAAGIDPTKKGMDISQCFGSSSSYARKYALNGMFLIDDTKDADASNTHGKTEVTKTVTKKKATKQVITAMKKAVAEGKKQAVIDRIEDYELSEQDVLDIMKGE